MCIVVFFYLNFPNSGWTCPFYAHGRGHWRVRRRLISIYLLIPAILSPAIFTSCGKHGRAPGRHLRHDDGWADKTLWRQPATYQTDLSSCCPHAAHTPPALVAHTTTLAADIPWLSPAVYLLKTGWDRGLRLSCFLWWHACFHCSLLRYSYIYATTLLSSSPCLLVSLSSSHLPRLIIPTHLPTRHCSGGMGFSLPCWCISGRFAHLSHTHAHHSLDVALCRVYHRDVPHVRHARLRTIDKQHPASLSFGIYIGVSPHCLFPSRFVPPIVPAEKFWLGGKNKKVLPYSYCLAYSACSSGGILRSNLTSTSARTGNILRARTWTLALKFRCIPIHPFIVVD